MTTLDEYQENHCNEYSSFEGHKRNAARDSKFVILFLWKKLSYVVGLTKLAKSSLVRFSLELPLVRFIDSFLFVSVQLRAFLIVLKSF